MVNGARTIPIEAPELPVISAYRPSALMLGEVGWSLLSHVAYLAVLGVLGIVGASRRIGRLLLT